jgi:putative ABC transport system permease protein
MGLILSLLAMGVLVSSRVFSFPDITPDGSLTLGASVAAMLLIRGTNPLVATAAAFVAGSLAGLTTGVLHTRFRIHGLLAGILVMTALYTVNLRVMGKSNIPLMEAKSLVTYAENVGIWLLGGASTVRVLGWDVAVRDLGTLVLSLTISAAAGSLLYAFFRTDLGTAMRATGDNAQMITALGVNVGWMTTGGLALSNGLVAMCGALVAQNQGFADVQMGIGMVVWGMASVIIGEALVGTRQLGLLIAGAVLGSVLFRLLVAIALRAGLDPNDLKLVTALFVFAALVLPGWIGQLLKRPPSPTRGQTGSWAVQKK